MQMLQQGLGPLGMGRPGVYSGDYPGREAFKPVVDRWQAARSGPEPPPIDWWEKAIPASDAVVELAGTWKSDGSVDFDTDAPTPTPTLRILPRV
jgi:hypothetical protein